MGMFDQIKAAGDMMKNMEPGQLKQMMEQAKEAQKMLEDTVKRLVEEEIKKRNLISRDEVQKMIDNK